tara:strand:- start:670 stop:1368 length:699 start_codon:yes stop_codon:yes gene_type:complete
MKVSVIVPLYNEEKTIVNILSKIQDEIIKLDKFNFEIIVINDGSNDNSKKLLEENPSLYNTLISLSDNRGKGFAIREGLKKVSGEIILIQDADLEYLPHNYKNLLEPFKEYNADVVYGSRLVYGEIHRVLFFWHVIANKIITFCSNLFTNLNLTDVETGYKVFKSDLLKKIDLKENSFAFEIEVTQKIAKIKPKLIIFEVGISYFGRTYNEGKKIGFKDAIYAIIAILKYSF